jgi:YD repeat-containing protein
VTKRIGIWISVVLMFLIATSTISTLGQDLPDVAQGIQPYISYHGGELDQVNLGNGHVTVRIPLFSFSQRGSLSLSYSLVFNSFSYIQVQTCVIRSCTSKTYVVPTSWNRSPTTPVGAQLVIDQEMEAGGISQLDPLYSGSQSLIGARYYVTTADGAQHPLGHTSTGVFRSVDGAGFLFQPSSSTEYPSELPVSPSTSGVSTLPGGLGGTVTDRKGIVYKVSSTGTSTITDPDGNAITWGGNGIIDSIGRNIPETSSSVSTTNCPTISAAEYQPLTSAIEWEIPAFGGTAPYIFCYATVNISTHLGIVSSSNQQFNGSFPFLQSVVLPNGQYWGFVYDSANTNNPQSYAYGQLQQLIYPTGGSIQYTTLMPGAGTSCDSIRNTGVGGGMSLTTFEPSISQREKFDGEGNTATWSYTLPSQSNLSGSVLTPAGDVTVTEFSSADGCGFIDAGEKVYKGSSPSGTSLKTRSLAYSFPAVPGYPQAYASLPQAETTVWQGANTATVTPVYDGGFLDQEIECTTTAPQTCQTGYSGQIPVGDVVSKVYTDFTGSTLKTETISYQWQSNSAYFTSNFLDIPSQTQTLNSSGSAIASATYTYDETAYSPPGTHGHPTTITRWLNTGTSPTSHTGWNSMGMKSFFIDAKNNTNGNGHTIDYGYTNTSAGCYGSVVTSETNALNQQTSGTYDCNTGLLQNYTDLNSKTTTLNYDALNRLKCVEYPNGGSTAFKINDAVGNLTVDKVVRLIGSDACSSTANNIDTEYAFDGLGRQLHTRLLSDPYGTIYTDTVYDNMGRVASVSNPYRWTSEPTYGITYYSYDALSRKVKQTDSDGSIQQWCYDNYSGYGQTNCHTLLGVGSGEWVDSSDEAGNDWQQVSDSLGRMTRAYEPNGASSAPSMETDDGYGALNDLLSVTQWGGASGSPNARSRSFTYDSLSRLLTAYNPETGTIVYNYDANSNLHTKTDARSITTTFTYDALNRVTSKSYSNDPSGTPSSCYQYDSSSVTNGIGRLSNAWTQESSAGTCPATAPAAFLTKRSVISYDPMGRVLNEQQFAPGNSTLGTITPPPSICANRSAETGLSYCYDLAGDLTFSTNGINSPSYLSGQSPIAFTNTYDGAGRLQTVTSNYTNNNVYPGNLFSPPTGQEQLPCAGTPSASAQYWPFGDLMNAALGNGVTLNRTYDIRIRTNCENDTGSLQ